MVTGYGQGFIWAENQIGWRWIYWGSCFFSILFGILLYFLPQSPRWLVLKALRGSTPLQMRELLLNKAHFKLAAIRKLTDVRVQYEFNEFVDNLTANKDRFSYFQTFKQRPFYRALSICAFLVIFQQVCSLFLGQKLVSVTYWTFIAHWKSSSELLRSHDVYERWFYHE